ncbi:MAG: hypothetical protein ACREHD_00895, partial [Pirellulales bacterium]
MRSFASLGRLLSLNAIIVFSSGVAQAAESVNLLTNSGVEEPADRENLPPGWFAASIAAPELRMFIEDRRSRAGNASLAIANQHQYDQTVCNNWAQDVRPIPAGKTVRLTAYLRTEQAESA